MSGIRVRRWPAGLEGGWGVSSVLALSATALAANATETAADTTGKGTVSLDTVTVVGSHIRRIDAQTQHPLLILERADLERTGLTEIADILQLTTIAGQSRNRGINNGGNGELRVNLRSLGDNRTLVLVDGRRWVSALDGGVDLTAIPMVLIERVEVLKDGASALYGSDAIAGVINIVTRRDYAGLEAGAYIAQNAHGDGLRRSYDLTWGEARDGWSVAAGVAYSKDDPILARDRAISATPVHGLPVGAAGSSITPFTGLLPESMADAGQFVRLIPGRPGTSPDDFRPFDSANDRYNYVAQNYLQTPLEQHSLFVQSRLELSPDLALSAGLMRNERRSAQQLAEPTVQFAPYFDGAEGQIVITADNVYNPFDEPVIAAVRRFSEAGARRFNQEVDTTRGYVALDGVFNLGGRAFTWGADATATRAQQDEFVSPYIDNSRLLLALGPSYRDGSGAVHCGTPGEPIAGCVPLNLFGPPGAMTPAMLEYVTRSVHNRKRAESARLAVHAEGAVATLPAGDLDIAVGLEHRNERGYDRPDALIESGNANGTGGTYTSTSGSYAVNEAFVEMRIPLLLDAAFARQLDITLAGRLSDYSAFGNTHKGQAGLRWRPTDDVLVRGSYSQGFRAPSILDLFAGEIRSVAWLTDPCAAENEPTPVVAARCAAAGVPVDVQQSNATNVTSGGNPHLAPETATHRSLGLMYTPQWADGLEASIDWYKVQIHDAIGERDGQSVVEDCYRRGDAGACARIRRAEDGSLIYVSAVAQNIPGGLETEGVDLGLRYRLPTRAGDFVMSWDTSYVSYFGEIGRPDRLTLLADGLPAQGNVVGNNRSPGGYYGVVWRTRSVLSLEWHRGAWSASATGRYFSAIDEDCGNVAYTASVVDDPALLDLCSNPTRVVELDGSGVGQEAPENRVGSVTFFDLQGSWQAPWEATFTLGVRNAFDRQAPVAYSAGANSFFADYDVPGRFWYASYRQKFW
ncbi:TonB-dependent receptor domain-containing protein [Tahibacter amnicola]|uniref:TonB-dependent receptor n=1 Tax=Tahibacter amnicola TaxID=2976241 RepID=A0ABY6BG59_9GAMM|nr:TonB-dependent receptor [Tahibacter amnicola]UXI66852.1 TonB-dependent receptor [Tahibacter amnicola]